MNFDLYDIYYKSRESIKGDSEINTYAWIKLCHELTFQFEIILNRIGIYSLESVVKPTTLTVLVKHTSNISERTQINIFFIIPKKIIYGDL